MDNREKYHFLILIFSVTLFIWFFNFSRGESKILETDFLDVGQGDSILIKTPNKQTILIDGGPDNKILEKLGQYLPPLKKQLDIVILTHPHADHATGLIEILKRYEVHLVILSGAFLKTEIYSEFLKAINHKTPVTIAKAGEAINFGGGAELDIISPESDSISVFDKRNESFGKAGGEINDSSVVSRLIFENFSMLLMGDATSKIESTLSKYGNNLKSDILKIGHHGSKYSSSFEFLNYVKPEAAIIEVGAKNRYGHPAQATLDKLKNFDISAFRTDKNGDIKILSDGVATNIYPEK